MWKLVKCLMLHTSNGRVGLGNSTPESVIVTTGDIMVDRFTYEQIT